MQGNEISEMLISTKTLMGLSIVIFLIMTLIIWLKLKAMSVYHNMIAVTCPSCNKTIDIAYNSIGHEVECPDCGNKFHTQSN